MEIVAVPIMECVEFLASERTKLAVLRAEEFWSIVLLARGVTSRTPAIEPDHVTVESRAKLFAYDPQAPTLGAKFPQYHGPCKAVRRPRELPIFAQAETFVTGCTGEHPEVLTIPLEVPYGLWVAISFPADRAYAGKRVKRRGPREIFTVECIFRFLAGWQRHVARLGRARQGKRGGSDFGRNAAGTFPFRQR
jgi:hypothetical protein